MRYLSVCSGIEAATVAWHPLGWQAAAFAEIEAFPRAVLAHHYPDIPLHGDFTTIRGDEYGPVHLLVGGTPCQDFSVAGLRAGVAGERGNLTLEFLRLASRVGPRWIVWENVPGVLSSDGGRALGSFLGGLAELGYGFAYRVLDAQYFGLAQRRARVFVVGYLGDWRRAAAVLFERQSLLRDSPPRRQAREGVAGALTPGAHPGGNGQDAYTGHLIAHTLKAEGFDAGEDGTGRGTPIVVNNTGQGWWNESATAATLRDMSAGSGSKEATLVAFSAKDHGADAGEIAPTLRAGGHDGSHANGGVMPAVAFGISSDCFDRSGDGAGATPGERSGLGLIEEQTHALRAKRPNGVALASAVRRLTPRECERLQGFPDDYTAITYRGKPAADGPRYKALGNSMAVPVMAWIGRRIAAVEAASPITLPAIRGSYGCGESAANEPVP